MSVWASGGSEFTHQVAGGVIGDPGLVAGAHVGDAEDVDQELGELVGPFCQSTSPLGQGWEDLKVDQD